MTALSPSAGWRVNQNCGPSPLPGLIPLSFFEQSFPRDRVDLKALSRLLPLELTGPEKEGHFLILTSAFPEDFPPAHTRAVHGFERPEPVQPPFPFSPEKGKMILGFGHIPGNSGLKPLSIKLAACSIGLYKVRINPERLWWEDFKLQELWKIRVPRGNYDIEIKSQDRYSTAVLSMGRPSQ